MTPEQRLIVAHRTMMSNPGHRLAQLNYAQALDDNGHGTAAKIVREAAKRDAAFHGMYREHLGYHENPGDTAHMYYAASTLIPGHYVVRHMHYTGRDSTLNQALLPHDHPIIEGLPESLRRAIQEHHNANS